MTATLTTTATREGARIGALVIVLALAALLGLAVGDVLNGRSGTTEGAPAPGAAVEAGTPSYADPHRQIIRSTAPANAPAQTDPRLHIWAPVDDGAAAPAQTDPRLHVWAPVDDGAAVPEQTDPRPHLWAEIDDTNDARATGPSPR